MRKFMAIAAVIAVVLGVLIAGQSPASAHGTKYRHGNDIVVTAPDHTSGSICDEERDGHWVRAYWYNQYGEVGTQDDGGDRTCDNAYFTEAATKVVICEENKGCKGPFDL